MYKVTNLGTEKIYDLNNSAQGTGIQFATNQAILYSGGQVTTLPVMATRGWAPNPEIPTVPAVLQSQGNAINANGDIAGTATVATPPSQVNISPGNPGFRAFLIYKGKFVDLHTPLTEISGHGYSWSTAMDVTDRRLDGGLSVVGVGDQGPWLINLVEGPVSFSLQASCLCQRPWGLPVPVPSLEGSPGQALSYVSIRINNFGRMALNSNTAVWFCDATSAVSPGFVTAITQASEGDAPWVQSFNDNQELLLWTYIQNGLKCSPTGNPGSLWMQANYQASNIGGSESTYENKRLMNNNGDVLLGGDILETGNNVSVFLNASGTPVDLIEYFGVNYLPVFQSNMKVWPQAINDSGQMVFWVQSTSAGNISVLLTPLNAPIPPAHPHIKFGGGLEKTIILQ
jgi:hypothetical protein